MAETYKGIGHKLLGGGDVFNVFSHSVLDGCCLSGVCRMGTDEEHTHRLEWLQ